MKIVFILFFICSSVFLAGCDVIPPKNDTLIPTTTVKNEEVTQTTTQVPNTVTVKPTMATDNSGGVPLPTAEDIIRSFVSLIEAKRPSDAVTMMKVTDDSEKQAWAVQFNAINSMKFIKSEKANESEWTSTKQMYKVTLDVQMNPNSVNAPIPYYGWDNGQNIRWFTMEKVGKMWRISTISTGP
jgi:hypothetical protein